MVQNTWGSVERYVNVEVVGGMCTVVVHVPYLIKIVRVAAVEFLGAM